MRKINACFQIPIQLHLHLPSFSVITQQIKFVTHSLIQFINDTNDIQKGSA